MICLVGLMGESHMRMKALFTLLLLGASHVAFAEGGCPAGQYPIGGQGVQGCAPIPSAGSGGGDLRPNGRWIKTWGAISMSDATGSMGASVGKRSKSEAEKEARGRCATYGATDCSTAITYKNQCVAYADPEKGSNGRISISAGPSKEVASAEVLKYCASRGGGVCVIRYTDCTEPLFKSF